MAARPSALRDGTEPENAEPPTAARCSTPRPPGRSPTSCPACRPPEGAAQRGIAYKTGTSYGYRDAWSIGFDGRYVLGVWVGRADAGAVPGLSGYVSAAPDPVRGLCQIRPCRRAAAPAAGRRHSRPKREDLPVTLARFASAQTTWSPRRPTEPAPQIVFPPDGARVDLGAASGSASPLVLKIQGGRAPFRWLANGKPLADIERRRTATWQPDGAGSSTLTVIDAAGRAASVNVFVE